MIFQRLVIEGLDFIRRWLFFWRGETPSPVPKPFEKVRSFDIAHRGRLSFVVGRDTPRAVRTWIFSPVASSSEYNTRTTRPRDYHLYLDECRLLTNAERLQLGMKPRHVTPKDQRPPALRYTHSIMILQASHYLTSSGQYEVSLIYQGDFDFGGITPRLTKTNARIAIDLAAKLCAVRHIPDLAWEEEIKQIYALVKGLHQEFNPNTEAYRLFTKVNRLDSLPIMWLMPE